MVYTMMALLESASPTRPAFESPSPNGLKQGSEVNSTTWCTLVTSKPRSRYHFSKGTANRILSPFRPPIRLRLDLEWCLPVVKFTNIHFHVPKQTLISRLYQYLLWAPNLTSSRVLITSVAMNLCNSLSVLLIRRHSRYQIFALL